MSERPPWASRTLRYATAVLVMLFGVAGATGSISAERTTISDEFEGCEHGKVYPLDDGRVLVCEEYSYSYSYRPEVYVLDSGTVLIDGDDYQASVTTGTVMKTRVDGDFEGCDFDRIIPLENGLLFECRQYGYHYAYRAEVMISVVDGTTTVTFDGESYSGTLYRR